MTRIKEKAVEMIQRMPDDDMFYVINILQSLEEMTDYIVTRNPNDFVDSRVKIIQPHELMRLL